MADSTVERGGTLSFAQEALWFFDQLVPGNACYNVPCIHRLAGPLDVDALGAALTAVTARHDILRARFSVVGGRPCQVIAHSQDVDMPVDDLSALPEWERELERQRLVLGETTTPFDLTIGPLFRARLLRLHPDDHVLIITMHHIVSDGWSIGVLTRELSALYDGFRSGTRPLLPELTLSYQEFASGQRLELQGAVLESHLDYWRRELHGLTATQFPTDRSRPAMRSYQGASQSFSLPACTLALLGGVCRLQRTTLFMSLLTAFQVLLSRYSGEDDVAVGVPVANRSRTELPPLIGCLVNTLVLRTDCSGDPSFAELLTRVRAVALDAYEHQDLPFELLVEGLRPPREVSRNPLVQTSVQLLDRQWSELRLTDLGVERLESPVATTRLDIELSMVQTQDGLDGRFVYSSELFDADTIRRLSGHFVALLEAVAAEPDCRLSELTMLSAAERSQLLVTWNDARPARTPELGLEDLGSPRPTAPDTAAVTGYDLTLTYSELDGRANRLAHHLRALHVGPEVVVGLCSERGAEMVVALLAILRAGGAYLPLDPRDPSPRLSFLLADAGAEVLITQDHLVDRFASSDAQFVCLDGERNEIARHPQTPLPPTAGGDALAYVIYTSGSTGTPKAVMVRRHALLNLLADMSERIGLGSGDVMMAITTLCFDIAALELYLPLLAGARVVVASTEAAADPRQLSYLLEEGATVMQATPATWAMLIDGGWRVPPGFKALSGGEALPPSLAEQLLGRGVHLWNLYGPTETTIWSTAMRVETSDDAKKIGRPIANTTAYILDRFLQPVPIGVAGELHLGGVGLARGYRNDPQLTAQRFIAHPFEAGPEARLYRTGDRARWRADGCIEFLGRLDDQVKVRGFRVEPGEIEAALMAHPAVGQAAVVKEQDGGGDTRLVAYVVPGGADYSSAVLRHDLAQQLPAYMIPSLFTAVRSLPLTANGKLDRPGLVAESDGETRASFVAPGNNNERVLAEIYAQLLGREAVSVEADFFDLGGHSLLAVQLIAVVESRLGVRLPLRVVYDARTVANLALALGSAEVPRSLPLLVRTGRTRAPLSLQQEALEPFKRSWLFNLRVRHRFFEAVDETALRAALGYVVGRHETLRTTFPERDGTRFQSISQSVPVELSGTDLRNTPAHEREDKLSRVVQQETEKPFELTVAPLFRARLVRLSEDESELVVAFEHRVADGTSRDIFLDELKEAYSSFVAGCEPALPLLPLQYADFASWQRECMTDERLQADFDYWRDKLKGVRVLPLVAYDRPPVKMQRARGVLDFNIASDVYRAMTRLARSGGTTVFVVSVAAAHGLLSLYSGESDIMTVTTLSGRDQGETAGLIGRFASFSRLRNDLSGDPRFETIVDRVRESVLGMFEHQHLPSSKVAEAMRGDAPVAPPDTSTPAPVTPIQVAYFRAVHHRWVPGASVVARPPCEDEPERELAIGPGLALSLSFFDDGDQMWGSLRYRLDIYERSTMQRFVAKLRRLLDVASNDPALRLSQLGALVAVGSNPP